MFKKANVVHKNISFKELLPNRVYCSIFYNKQLMRLQFIPLFYKMVKLNSLS